MGKLHPSVLLVIIIRNSSSNVVLLCEIHIIYREQLYRILVLFWWFPIEMLFFINHQNILTKIKLNYVHYFKICMVKTFWPEKKRNTQIKYRKILSSLVKGHQRLKWVRIKWLRLVMRNNKIWTMRIIISWKWLTDSKTNRLNWYIVSVMASDPFSTMLSSDCFFLSLGGGGSEYVFGAEEWWTSFIF